MALNRTQTSYLRSLAHALKPVILVGNKGVTINLIKELDAALDIHELIKIRISADDRVARDVIADELINKSKSDKVQKIGNVICLFRRNPAEPKIELPRSSKK